MQFDDIIKMIEANNDLFGTEKIQISGELGQRRAAWRADAGNMRLADPFFLPEQLREIVPGKIKRLFWEITGKEDSGLGGDWHRMAIGHLDENAPEDCWALFVDVVDENNDGGGIGDIELLEGHENILELVRNHQADIMKEKAREIMLLITSACGKDPIKQMAMKQALRKIDVVGFLAAWDSEAQASAMERDTAQPGSSTSKPPGRL